jgi:hypothetical protein
MAKIKVSPALAAVLLPLATIIVTGAGKLWDASRDAFNAALADLKEPEDAAAAVKSVITDNLKGNPGSARAYLSTLVWLVKHGHDTATLSMQAATDLRYPKVKRLKPGEVGYVEQAAQRDAEARQKAEKAEAERIEAEKDNPAAGYLRQIVAAVSGLDVAQLALVTAELLSIVEAIKAEDAVTAEESEAEQSQAA